MLLNDSLEALKALAAEAVQAAAKATRSAATYTRANLNILTEQEKLKKAYAELGKLYYRDFITNEEPDDAEYLPLCDRITELTKGIEELRGAIDDMRASKEAPAEEAAPAEEEAPLNMEDELSNLHEELDKLHEDLQKLDGVEKPADAVFEVVEDTPKE